jgi:hypothetical protein
LDCAPLTGDIAVGTRERSGAGEPRTQGETSRALSETLQVKKLKDWLRRHKSVSTAVITAQNLTQLPKVPNQVAGIEQSRLPAHD